MFGNNVAMDAEEIDLALSGEQHKIINYPDLMNFEPDSLVNFQNIVLFFGYPGQEGHWTALMFHPTAHKLVFFDPYGLRLDDEWSYLINPEHLLPPTKILSEKILPYFQENGWEVDVNRNDIQGYFDNISKSSPVTEDIAQNLCGELVVLRIIYRYLSNNQFSSIIKRYSPQQIVDVITKIIRHWK